MVLTGFIAWSFPWTTHSYIPVSWSGVGRMGSTWISWLIMQNSPSNSQEKGKHCYCLARNNPPSLWKIPHWISSDRESLHPAEFSFDGIDSKSVSQHLALGQLCQHWPIISPLSNLCWELCLCICSTLQSITVIPFDIWFLHYFQMLHNDAIPIIGRYTMHVRYV